MLKRAFDIVFSLLSLAVLAPLASVIAVLIKLETPGSILTSRTCVGRHGKQFALYHFRTTTVATARSFSSSDRCPKKRPSSKRSGVRWHPKGSQAREYAG